MLSKSRVRLLGTVMLAAITGSAFTVMAQEPADAFNTLSCRFSSSTVRVSVVSGYVTPTNEAINSWNGSGISVANLIKVTSGSYELLVSDENNGSNGIDGITYHSCGTGSRWKTPAVSAYNTYYANGYGATGRKQLMVHEIGHAFGLAHAGTATCSTQPIMFKSSDRWFVCGHQNPRSDDVAGVNWWY